jgi:hypothetical protein
MDLLFRPFFARWNLLARVAAPLVPAHELFIYGELLYEFIL